MKKSILILLLILNVNESFCQVFLIQPNSDTIFYDSKFFDLDTSKFIYSLGSESYDHSKNTYRYCTKKLHINKINKIQSNHYSNNNLYNNYNFDRYINASIFEQTCFDVPKEVMFTKGNILSKFIIVQFEQEVDTMVFENLFTRLVGNDTIFDFNNKIAYFDQQEYQIQDYGGLSIDFINDNKCNINVVYIQMSENEMEGYYVVSDGKGVIISTYRFHNQTDER